MKAKEAQPLTAPPPVAARKAGLRYVSDERPGIARELKGKDFVYRTSDGTAVRDEETLRRIRSLVIPPAWTQVWICPIENGHIQATGRDARGRKQYRYHPLWHQVRDEAKYDRVLAFAEALPKIRQKVAADLRRRGLSREKVMATVVRLLETTLIRVGNDEYVQQNGSYGLTTMHNRHAKVQGGRITFEFKGKSGKRHRIDVRDARLAKMVRRCQELPGQDLFGYVDEEGKVHDVTSSDVNDYLREIAGTDFSAKDFRTWAGTVLAALALRQFEAFSSQREAKRNTLRAVESVSRLLGNTPAVCRRCYVHPAILEGYLTGLTIGALQSRVKESPAGSLRAEETAVLKLIRKRVEKKLAQAA